MTEKKNFNTKISILIIIFFSFYILKYLPFDDNVISPVNLLSKFKGFELKDATIASFERSDIIDASIPNHLSYCKALQNNQDSIFGWDFTLNKKILNFYSGKYNPLTSTPCLFNNFAEGMDVYYFLKTLLFSLGMFLFLRIYFSNFTSIIGTFASVGSSFFSGWFFHNHTLVLCFLPWVLWSIKNIFTSQNYKFFLFLYLISLYFLISSGFLFIIFICLIVIAIYFLINIIFLKKNNKSIINFKLLIFFLISCSLSIFLILEILPLLNALEKSNYLNLRSENFNFLIPISDLSKLNFLNAYQNLSVEESMYFGFFLFYSFPFFFLFKKKNKELILFSIWVVILLFLVYFENYFSNILLNLKVFNSNDVRRISFLFLFSFLPLGLVTIENVKDYLFLKNKFIYSIFIFLFFIISSYDGINYFSRFNKPSLKKNFYYNTEATNYLKKNLSEIQYVLPDYNFYFNGTLRFFGINDIFSHKLRSKKYNSYLNNIHKNHNSSFTSSKIDFFKINFFSPYMNLYNIKYIITDNRNNINLKIIFENLYEKNSKIKKLENNTVGLNFELNKNKELSAIQLFFLTYQKRIVENINFQFKDIDGSIVYEEKFNNVEIYDNQPITFEFKKSLALDSGKYKLIVSTAEKNNIALRYKNNSFNNKDLVLLDKENPKIRFFTHYNQKERKNLQNNYSQIFKNQKIKIIENKKVVGQYYYIDKKTFATLNKKINDNTLVNTFTNKNNKINLLNNYQFTIDIEDQYKSNNYYLIIPIFKNDFDWSVFDDKNRNQKIHEFQKIVAIKMKEDINKFIFKLNK